MEKAEDQIETCPQAPERTNCDACSVDKLAPGAGSMLRLHVRPETHRSWEAPFFVRASQDTSTPMALSLSDMSVAQGSGVKAS